MKKRIWAFSIPAVILLAAFLVPLLLTSQSAVMDKPSKEDVAYKMQRIQIPFVANNGQVDAQVKFYANTFGGTVFVTKEGEIVYALPNNSSDVETQCLASSMHSPGGISPLERGDKGVCNTTPISNDRNETHPRPIPYRSMGQALLEGRSGVALKEQFVGAKVKTIQGEEKAVTRVNYFKGKDPSKWKTNISSYDVVSLGEVYDGIELKLKAYGNNVEKLFCVKSGANPEQIKISLSGIQPSGNPPPLSPSVRGTGGCPPLAGAGGGLGARGLWVNEHGALVAETELGPVKFTKPVAYQEINGKRVDVECKYTIADCGMQNADCKTNLKSETRNLSSTSIGDPQLEYGFRVASYDKSHDLIIDPLLASTYLGGSGSDIGYSLALDTSGNVYVTGYTESTTFPTTSGAYNTSGNYDVFVSKLNGGLTNLLASTYLGGSGNDYGYSLTIDTSGNVYVTGYTGSPDFPTTSGTYDTVQNDDSYDVFVSKLDDGLTSLLASTYLGGSYRDSGYSLTLDNSGNVYVTGYTYSKDFPTTSGGYNTSVNGGNWDVFVSKLNSGLTSLLSSTYLGGSGGEIGYSLTIDTSGNVYVMGKTSSSDFPTTSGVYDTSFNNSSSPGYSDVFVSKLDGGLMSLLASTYLGGSNDDDGRSIALDTSGNVYVTGETSSADFPTTSGAYDTSQNDSEDVFVSKLNSGLTSLLASTYLGGGYGRSLALDTNGNVYVTGETASSGFPTTNGAYDTSLSGDYDVFVSKLDGGLTSLLASTYLGGSIDDFSYSLTLDTSGNVYVTGETSSSNFPTTSGVYDTSYNDSGDVFVSKVDSDLSASTIFTPIPTPPPVSSPSPLPTLPPLPTPIPSPSLSKYGQISGYVYDMKGNPIETVMLKLKGVKVGYSKITYSDDYGFFEFVDLDAGTYTIISNKKGYKRVKSIVEVNAGREEEIEISMKKLRKKIITR